VTSKLLIRNGPWIFHGVPRAGFAGYREVSDVTILDE
jgi:hypothetical protein